MLDTNGPQLQVLNKTEKELVMEKDKEVTLTSDTSVIASPTILPTNYPDLWKAGVFQLKMSQTKDPH